MKTYLSQFAPLPRIYIKEGIQDTAGVFDHRFDIRHDYELDKFSIGDSHITFDGGDMIIKNVRYKGTVGLYEFLFKNTPIGFNRNAEKEYSDIIKVTYTF